MLCRRRIASAINSNALAGAELRDAREIQQLPRHWHVRESFNALVEQSKRRLGQALPEGLVFRSFAQQVPRSI